MVVISSHSRKAKGFFSIRSMVLRILSPAIPQSESDFPLLYFITLFYNNDYTHTTVPSFYRSIALSSTYYILFTTYFFTLLFPFNFTNFQLSTSSVGSRGCLPLKPPPGFELLSLNNKPNFSYL